MEQLWLLMLLLLMPALDMPLFLPTTKGWYLRIWKYYGYLLCRATLAVGAWFALGTTDLSPPYLRVFIAAAGGVIILENASLKPIGVSLSLGNQLDDWRKNLLEEAGDYGRRKEYQSRLKLIEALTAIADDKVVERARDMIAAMDDEFNRDATEVELEIILEQEAINPGSLRRGLAVLMMKIDEKSAKVFAKL